MLRSGGAPGRGGRRDGQPADAGARLVPLEVQQGPRVALEALRPFSPDYIILLYYIILYYILLYHIIV